MDLKFILLLQTLTYFQMGENLPNQHSNLEHGSIFTKSGGSTPTFRHKTSATDTVFICKVINTE